MRAKRRPGPRPKSTPPFSLLAVVVLMATGCAAESWVLRPSGPGAARIAGVLWLLIALATAVLGLAFILLAFAMFRRRAFDAPGKFWTTPRFLVVTGVGIPAAAFSIIMAATVATGAAVYQPPSEATLEIEVVGHQFWWQVRYDDGAVETANEIHIPVGEPVRLRLLGGDVIHSFWVPELHGKMDLIPGQVNTFWIQADESGRYRGFCAEFCGLQHAKMHKFVVAEPREEFEAWLEQQRADAPPADGESDAIAAGRDVFSASGCIRCHTIRGVGGPEDAIGPDLTHLASRETLAAGALPNTRGHLGGWILDPQTIKPGARMPPTRLGSEDLQALLDYLETLE